MTEFIEGRHAGEAVLHEANGSRSRDSITIPAGTGVVEPGTVLGVDPSGNYVPSATVDGEGDGTEIAVAMNIHGVDATDADVVVAAITRDAELNGACLVFEASVDTDAKKLAKTAELAEVGIIVR